MPDEELSEEYYRERERLRKLREEALRRRDPGSSKIPGYNWDRPSQIASRRQERLGKAKKEGGFSDLHPAWQGTLLGLLIGGVLSLLLLAVVSSQNQRFAAVPVVALTMLGFALGWAMYTQTE